MLANELHQALGVGIVLELEVDAIMVFDNVNAFIVGTVSQNQLLQVQEGTLVGHTLAYLHLTGPRVGRVVLLAVITLLVLHDEFYLESLLEQGVGLDFFLDGQLEFDSPGVGLCVDEFSVE